MSEFCNSWINLEFENWKKKNPSAIKQNLKKHFRPTPEYSQTISEIKSALIQIFKIANFCNDDFTSVSVSSIMDRFGKSDFNDSYYIELSTKNKWKIVTDDSDFNNSGLSVTIISANV